MLELIDSQITYRARYLVGVSLELVRDMAILDTYNPRSVAFQVERLSEHLANLPQLNQDGMLEVPRRMVLQLLADLTTAVAADLDNDGDHGLRAAPARTRRGDRRTRYFLHGPNAVKADKSMGLA